MVSKEDPLHIPFFHINIMVLHMPVNQLTELRFELNFAFIAVLLLVGGRAMDSRFRSMKKQCYSRFRSMKMLCFFSESN
jgi:hypothetical protein